MERVAKSQIYQASLTEMAKVFPPMREEDVDRGPIDHRSRNGNILCLGYILVTTEHPQEVLYEHCFIKLRQRDKIKCSATTHLYRIHGEPFSHMCQIALAIKNSDFQWTPEAEEAFKQMKKLITELPTLTAPREHEELIIYLAAAKEAISAVLMTDREGRQIPVYFVSRTLRGPEVNYTPMEKLVLACSLQAQRLKRILPSTHDLVITNQPIKQLLSSSEISGRMLKWKFELEGYDIQYRPRTAIKGQILADFIVERPEEESPDELMTEPEVLPEPFEATNNEAEYEALIAGLRIAEQMGVKNLQANVDSRLVANQVNGSYIAKESGMVQYLDKVKTLAKSFKEFSIKQIPRSENKKADALSKIASTSFAHLNKQVLIEELKEKSINEKEILDVVEEEGNTWMTPICEYLAKEILPEDKKKARAVRRKASRFGLPREIISDNGKQFRDNPFKDWSVIPAEIGMPTLQTAEIGPAKNNKALEINLDLIEEKREQAAIQEAKSKKNMEKYYNSRVRCTSFKPGDMVYRSNEASHARDEGKLGPKWEGPYEVKESLGKGAYKLKDCKGNEMPRTWNICNLKKCYIHEV
ncbi:reverse transcriptase domain-containing protein [Tanacetum coccineum]